MTDLLSTIPTLDLAELADLTGCDFAQPFDDAPSFDPGTDPEVNVNARLPTDRAMVETPVRRLFVDYRANPDAYKHLEQLPLEGESLHGIISGKYALWDMVPALIERTGDTINDLHIATLSYGKQNAAELLGLIDAGQVKRCSLLVSYFFKAQNKSLYDTLVPQLRARGHPVLAMRTHAKIILARMQSGAHYVAEASANLRSCKNIEQFVLSRSPELYEFHRSWIDELINEGHEEGEDYE
jgi:hypothetical protein